MSVKPKIYARAVIAIALIISWILSAFSGLILWLAPEVRRAGQQPLLTCPPENDTSYNLIKGGIKG